MAKRKYKPIPKLTEIQRVRFWSKVDKTPSHGPKGDCWPWKASVDECGYGYFGISASEVLRAHRVAYSDFYGDNLEGMEACHSCDFPPCCNPAHIFKGSHADNMKDCYAKGRHSILNKEYRRRLLTANLLVDRSGERGGNHKLSADNVREIRLRFSHGESKSSIARRFSVTHENVASIIKRRTWGSVV